MSRDASDHWTLDLGRLESLLRDTDAEMGHRIEKLCERIAALEAEVAALKQPKTPPWPTPRVELPDEGT